MKYLLMRILWMYNVMHQCNVHNAQAIILCFVYLLKKSGWQIGVGHFR